MVGSGNLAAVGSRDSAALMFRSSKGPAAAAKTLSGQ